MSKNLTESKDDLAVIVGEKIEISDRHGKKHRLGALDLQDVNELQKRIKTEQAGQEISNWETDMAMFVIWLSLRKEGLSDEDIDRERWAYTEKQCMRLFDARFFRAMPPILDHLLKLSGFEIAKGEKEKEQGGAGNPPNPPSAGEDGSQNKAPSSGAESVIS